MSTGETFGMAAVILSTGIGFAAVIWAICVAGQVRKPPEHNDGSMRTEQHEDL